MFEPTEFAIKIKQGSQYELAFHWYGGGKVVQAIEDITVGAPTIIKITGHGLPSASRTPIIVQNVRGLPMLNTGLKECDRLMATYIDPDTFSVETDTRAHTWRAGTGSIVWYQPKDLTGYTGRMQIREFIDDAAPLVSLTSGSGITINTADARVTAIVSTAESEALDFIEGVYDLELVDLTSEAVRVLFGKVLLSKEVTR